jgi:pantetheine-phosphate adenylyltransferase
VFGGDISKFVTPSIRDEVIARIDRDGLRRI